LAVAIAAALLLSLAVIQTSVAGSDNRHRLFSENLQYDGVTRCREAKDDWKKFNSPSNRDSPLDSNTNAYRLIVPAGCYIAFATRYSIEQLNVPVEEVENLSFDWRTPAGDPPGTVAGGSPRIVVFLDNGDLVAIDAANCWREIPASGGTWARTDATGFHSTDAPCTIYENNVTPYTNTPTMSAWDVFAAAHPGHSVTYAFVVVDQPGTYYLDRIAFGTGKLYGKNNEPSRNCPNEGAC
jgi:hypothetical protein